MNGTNPTQKDVPTDDQHTLDLFARTTDGQALVPVTDHAPRAMTDGGARAPNMTCRNADCERRFNFADEGPKCPDCDSFGSQDPEPEGVVDLE